MPAGGRGAARDSGKGGQGGKSKSSGCGSKGKSKGRGKGSAKDSAEGPTGGDPRAAAGKKSGGSASLPKASRKQIDSLRAFSTQQWWTIGREIQASRRTKPDDFQQACAKKHEEMRRVYESAMMQDSEQRWLRKVSGEGTASDRAASLVMLIQVCPVFSTGYIKNLLTLAGKLGRSDSMTAVDALKELLITTLLPDRKLKTLAQMEPISPKGLSEEQYTERCSVAFFEDYLKTAFAAFIHILSEAAHATVTFMKIKAIRAAFELLSTKPEQERALLSLLVNKFGDLAPKVSSNVGFHLKKLLEVHPGMKGIVAKEVEAFLARPNITRKSQYCAVLYLSEIKLTRKEVELAVQLIKLFVARLEEALKPARRSKKEALRAKRLRWRPNKRASSLGEDDNRLIRTLVGGIQRALPYLDNAMVTTSMMQEDTVNALFKVCHTVSAFSTRIAIMTLLFQCLFKQGAAPDRFYRLVYDQIAKFELFSCAHKLQAFLLLRKCAPADPSSVRGLALARRLLQIGAGSEPAVAVAALAVFRELLTAHRAEMRPLLQSVESSLQPQLDRDEDGEEQFRDDDVEPDASKTQATEVALLRYQPLARDPRFSRAGHSPLWELYAMAVHVHPSVAYGATRLLNCEQYRDVGDNPFETFSCGELMEQFVLASRAHRGEKVKGRGKDTDKEKDNKSKVARVAFTSEHFSRQKHVSPHEKFFQLYFCDAAVRAAQRRKAQRKREHEDDFDEEGGGEAAAEEADEDEEDKFFDEYIQGQMPKDGDADEDDVDIDDDSDNVDSDDAPSDVPEEFQEPDSDEAASEEAGEASSDAEEGGAEPRGTKRRAPEPASKQQRIKVLKMKHSGSIFASMEDFEQLLAEDFS